jgi:hypothetical protein
MFDSANAFFTMPNAPEPSACPCGGSVFATCCGPYLAGDAVAPTAETLMRSRYSAYTLRDEAYLRATWHPSTLPAAPERPVALVYSWIIEPAAAERVSVRFEEDGGVTEVVLVHERIADSASRDQQAAGWDGCLDGLAALVASR